MKTKRIFSIVLTAALTLGLLSCNGDSENTLNPTPEDAYETLLAEGSDRVLTYQLRGKVKSFTSNRYYSVDYVDNAIKKGRLEEQSTVEFNEQGFTVKEESVLNLPAACKWVKDSDDDYVMEVTAWESVPSENTTYQYDAARKDRLVEIQIKQTYYDLEMGGAVIETYAISRDTVWYWWSYDEPDFSDNTLKKSIYESVTKATITYDDANQQAAMVISFFDKKQNKFMENERILLELDEYSRVNSGMIASFLYKEGYSYLKAMQSNDSEPEYTGKVIEERDAHGNITLWYILYKGEVGRVGVITAKRASKAVEDTGYYVGTYYEYEYSYY